MPGKRKWSTRLRIVGRRAWGRAVRRRIVVSAGRLLEGLQEDVGRGGFIRSASCRTATFGRETAGETLIRPIRSRTASDLDRARLAGGPQLEAVGMAVGRDSARPPGEPWFSRRSASARPAAERPSASSPARSRPWERRPRPMARSMTATAGVPAKAGGQGTAARGHPAMRALTAVPDLLLGRGLVLGAVDDDEALPGMPLASTR